MLRDEELDDLLRDARLTYHTPSEPPLDAMWAEVERAHFGGCTLAWGRARPLSFRVASFAAAAALLMGVALGRWTARDGGRVNGDARRVADARATEPGTAVRAPRGPVADSPVAATTSQYLAQTVALLVSLRHDAETGRTDRRFVAQATDLLSTTRLLLDSPAALDPELKGLLDDLELVLAQIARLPARPRADGSRSELELITRSLEQHDVVPRLRSAAAGLANSLPSGSSDD